MEDDSDKEVMGNLEHNTERIRKRCGNSIQQLYQEGKQKPKKLFVRIAQQDLRGQQETIALQIGWSTFEVNPTKSI